MIFGLIFLFQYSFAQQVFVCQNPNGSTETLSLSAAGVFSYINSKNNKVIALKIKNYESSTQTYAMQFPGDAKVYLLKMNEANDRIDCTNPDGTKQVFILQKKKVLYETIYICKNADGSIERLHCFNSSDRCECEPYYSSGINPKKIKLKVIDYTPMYIATTRVGE
ncbi:MAG: hypothetical protein H7Y04_01790, partial [Verrucomicrobia bacterium]|nr:hypothetical protein [Cytophagales bacterium]